MTRVITRYRSDPSFQEHTYGSLLYRRYIGFRFEWSYNNRYIFFIQHAYVIDGRLNASL